MRMIRFIFNIEAEDLHRPGFSFGYVVAQVNPTTKEFIILERADCHSIEGAQAACDWVKENVLPSIKELYPYLSVNLASLDPKDLPSNIVKTKHELRERFYVAYLKYKDLGAEFWCDVTYPVISNFLSAVVSDGQRSRDFTMPYPLRDLANFLDFKVNRIEYSSLKGLVRHNPINDSMAKIYSLSKFENALAANQNIKPFICSTESKIRFVFDVGAQDLHLPSFAFGYVVTRGEGSELDIIEKGLCISIESAREAENYVKRNSLPHFNMLHTYLKMSSEELKQQKLPEELVMSIRELRERFYAVYAKWRSTGAEIYSADVGFPVETNFLAKIVEDGEGQRNWNMPYPLTDVSSLLSVDVSRTSFTGLQHFRKGNPLHHALASSCALYMHQAGVGELEKINQIRSLYQYHIESTEQLNHSAFSPEIST